MIQVVVAVIQGDDGRFFVCQRQAHQSFAGYWEFPGGKQESDEDSSEAMARELIEEVAIQVTKMTEVMSIPSEQAGVKLCLHIWHVTEWLGQAQGAEGQACAWVTRDQLAELTLPPANAVLVEAVLAGDFGVLS